MVGKNDAKLPMQFIRRHSFESTTEDDVSSGRDFTVPPKIGFPETGDQSASSNVKINVMELNHTALNSTKAGSQEDKILGETLSH